MSTITRTGCTAASSAVMCFSVQMRNLTRALAGPRSLIRQLLKISGLVQTILMVRIAQRFFAKIAAVTSGTFLTMVPRRKVANGTASTPFASILRRKIVKYDRRRGRGVFRHSVGDSLPLSKTFVLVLVKLQSFLENTAAQVPSPRAPQSLSVRTNGKK